MHQSGIDFGVLWRSCSVVDFQVQGWAVFAVHFLLHCFDSTGKLCLSMHAACIFTATGDATLPYCGHDFFIFLLAVLQPYYSLCLWAGCVGSVEAILWSLPLDRLCWQCCSHIVVYASGRAVLAMLKPYCGLCLWTGCVGNVEAIIVVYASGQAVLAMWQPYCGLCLWTGCVGNVAAILWSMPLDRLCWQC